MTVTQSEIFNLLVQNGPVKITFLVGHAKYHPGKITPHLHIIYTYFSL